MLILSPADGAAEVPALAEAGADELYAGYVPAFWSEAFGPVVSSNRRSYEEANVPSLDALDALLLAAAVRDLPVFVALNASPLPEAMLPPLIETVVDLSRRGVRGVVVSDLAFLLALKERGFRRLQLHASTLFSVFNGAAVAFLRRAGAARVVLARELSTEEIGAMVSRTQGVPLEVIAMRGRCPNIEGFCTHLHDDPRRTWPCELKYEMTPAGDGAVPEEVRASLARDEGTDRFFSCGLCAIPLLLRMGVHAVKIAGRGAETARKVAAVAAVRRMRDWGRAENPGIAECERRGKALYEEIFRRPCRRENCYFPEFRPGGEG